jgi:hypothetical protein
MKITLKTTVEQEITCETPCFRASDIKAVAIFETHTVAIWRIKWMNETETTRIEVEPHDIHHAVSQTSTVGRAILESDYRDITKDEFMQWMTAAQNDIAVQIQNIEDL